MDFSNIYTIKAQSLFSLLNHQTVHQETWIIANRLSVLEKVHQKERGSYPDIPSLAWKLFEAGRITGVREERQRRNK